MEARRLAPGATLLPPAGRGDVAGALRLRPSVILLVDGVFEARPSVWHREILAALEEGIAVFGAASMGALRAAELWPFGMVGVGSVFRAYREGTLIDDSEVALLHADRAHGYCPFTVPLVSVRGLVGEARARRLLTAREAEVAVRRAEAIFYQERTWPRVLAGMPQRTRAAVDALRAIAPDVKTEDARAGLRAAAEFGALGQVSALPPSWPPPSALVRARLGLRSKLGFTDQALASLGRGLGASIDVAPGRGTYRDREQVAFAAWVKRNAPVLWPR